MKRILSHTDSMGEVADRALTEPSRVLQAELLKIFHVIDHDSSGTVSYQELRTGLTAVGMHMSKYEFHALMRLLDPNQDGQIDQAEWLALFRSSEKDLKEGRMASYLGSASMKDLRNVADSDGLVGAVVHGGLGMARASAATIGLAPAAIASRARLPSRLAPAKEGWAEGDVLSGGDHDVADGGAVRPPASAEP